MKKILVVWVGLLLSLTVQAAQCEEGLLQSSCKHLSQVWDEGKTTLLVSGWSWHNRSTYDRDKIDSYNEFAYGGGVGRVHRGEDGNEAMLYLMAFADSHEQVQGHAGYAYMWYWGTPGSLRGGLGLTGGLATRADMYNNVPFPYVLPLVSLQFDPVTLYATYLPSLGENNGNVAFVFGRIDF